MDPVKTLIDRVVRADPAVLPAELRRLYDGDLQFPAGTEQRPHVIANFVSTLDGVVSYRMEGHAGGATISGSDPADRFIMALLRAAVDAIVVGSKTVHDVGRKALWIPSGTWQEGKELLADYRTNVLRKPEYPVVMIISGSGRLELDRAVFRTPRTVIATTAAGEKELARRGVGKLEAVTTKVVPGSGGRITPEAILRLLKKEFGATVVLNEGGPTLLGEFLGEGLVDELFLTFAPQIAGRLSHTERIGLVSGVEFLPDTAPWLELLSVKQQGEHLYLRYRVEGARRTKDKIENQ